MESPWGHVDGTEKFAAGVISVSTPSHGGFRVGARVGVRMSQEARERATFTWVDVGFGDPGSVYWYEEDCDWMIAAWELPELWPQMFRYIEGVADPKAYLFEGLSYWHPGYLRAVGVEPDAAALARAGR